MGKNGRLNQSPLLLNGIPLPFAFLSDLTDFRQLPCRPERERLNSLLFLYTVVPQYPREIGSRISLGYQNQSNLQSLVENGVVQLALRIRGFRVHGFNQPQIKMGLVESVL